MRPVSGKAFCRALERQGWTLRRVNGSHHVYEDRDGTIASVPVHANRDLRPGTQRGLMRQADLTDAELA